MTPGRTSFSSNHSIAPGHPQNGPLTPFDNVLIERSVAAWSTGS